MPKKVVSPFSLFAMVLLAGPGAAESQNPSPMVEYTRAHTRLTEERPPGQRIPLQVGTLFVPEHLPPRAPLFVHLHGGTWIAELAAKQVQAAVLAVHLGTGSSVYSRPFSEPGAFAALIAEAEAKSGRRFSTIGLTAWSAGYGGVRAILREP